MDEDCPANPARALLGMQYAEAFPEYLACPHCGELEVEVWCYDPGVRCHICGGWIEHTPPHCFGTDYCQVKSAEHKKTRP